MSNVDILSISITVMKSSLSKRGIESFVSEPKKTLLLSSSEYIYLTGFALCCRCMERDTNGISLEVPSQFCDPFVKPLNEETCQRFCTNQCVMSQWSEWSRCSVSFVSRQFLHLKLHTSPQKKRWTLKRRWPMTPFFPLLM